MKSYSHLLCVISFSFIFLLTSCSKKKLDKGEAKELIIQVLKYPQTETMDFAYGEVNLNTNEEINSRQDLAQQNLITFTRADRSCFACVPFDLALTTEGEKYKIGDTTKGNGRNYYLMKIAEKSFNEISDIRESKSGEYTEVQYTWKYTNITPFGKAYNYAEKLNKTGKYAFPVYNFGGIMTSTVKFIRNGDTWKLE